MDNNYNTMRKVSSRLFILVGALAACQIHATPVPVINPGFGYVDNISGCSSTNTLDAGSFLDDNTSYAGGCADTTPFGSTAGSSGWSVTGPDAGVLYPDGGLYSEAVPGPGSPTNVAFINSGNLVQTLSSTLIVGTYTLTVDIGSRGDGHPLNNYTVELLAGGVVIASDSSNELGITAGTYGLDTITANILAGNVNIGQDLGIELISSQTLGTTQADFANVALNFQAPTSGVPEPANWLLAGAGFAALIARRFTSRRSRP